MKIVRVDDDHIVFDTGDTITYDHEQDCCEVNYADFKQLDDIAKAHVFKEPIVFEPVEDNGFRFGNPGAMFFVPCYSAQNGYYSYDIDIYFNGNHVLDCRCDNDIFGY